MGGTRRAAQDVLYFFATSLSLDALHRADELLARYHARLVADLRARGEAGTAAAEAYDLDRLSRDIDVQATDYARFAMGSMWGEVTPESMARDAPKQNVGMHRRSLPHLHWLVRRAAKGLDAMECERPGDAPRAGPRRAAQAAGEGPRAEARRTRGATRRRTPRDVRLPRGRGGGYRSRRRRERTPRRRSR